MRVDEETRQLYEYSAHKFNRLELAYPHIMEPMNPTKGFAFHLEGTVTEHFLKSFRGTLITSTDYSLN